ncbi:MAG: hypothetical protein IBJ03_12870 [Gemmatimonadaceae bacterium]|nr:hypothetical protein [Gemmatimonadaceae bacterium]
MSELSVMTPDGGSRFRAGTAWYASQRVTLSPENTSARNNAVVRTIVGAPAERLVDLLHAFCVHLDPAVDVWMRDLRSGRRWRGALLPLPDARDVIGRLRYTITAFGGIELAVYTDQDQLTITPELLLVIDARTDRWLYHLDAEGFESREVPPDPTWRPHVVARKRDAQLEETLWVAAERLGLEEVRG